MKLPASPPPDRDQDLGAPPCQHGRATKTFLPKLAGSQGRNYSFRGSRPQNDDVECLPCCRHSPYARTEFSEATMYVILFEKRICENAPWVRRTSMVSNARLGAGICPRPIYRHTVALKKLGEICRTTSFLLHVDDK